MTLAREGAKLIASHAPGSELIYGALERRFGLERLRQLQLLLRELEEAADSLVVKS